MRQRRGTRPQWDQRVMRCGIGGKKVRSPPKPEVQQLTHYPQPVELRRLQSPDARDLLRYMKNAGSVRVREAPSPDMSPVDERAVGAAPSPARPGSSPGSPRTGFWLQERRLSHDRLKAAFLLSGRGWRRLCAAAFFAGRTRAYASGSKGVPAARRAGSERRAFQADRQKS